MCEIRNVRIFHCVGMQICHFQYFLLRLSCYLWTSALVTRLPRVTSVLLWCFQPILKTRAKASLCVYPKDYNLLCCWKQKKDLATPIIFLLFLTIKAWRNKYSNRRVVVHSVFSSNQQVPSSHKPPHSTPVPDAPTQKTVYCHNAAGEKIFLHSWAIYFSKCRSELLLNYGWKVVMAPSCMGQSK